MATKFIFVTCWQFIWYSLRIVICLQSNYNEKEWLEKVEPVSHSQVDKKYSINHITNWIIFMRLRGLWCISKLYPSQKKIQFLANIKIVGNGIKTSHNCVCSIKYCTHSCSLLILYFMLSLHCFNTYFNGIGCC